MTGIFKELVGKGLVYGLGSSFNGLAAFLLIPFFITRLSAAEYGRFAIAEMVLSLTLVLLGMGLHVALLSRYPHLDPTGRRDVVGSLVTFVAATSLAGTALLLAVALPLRSVLLGGISPEMIALVAAIAAVEAVWLVFATYFRAEGLARRYVLLSFAQVVAGLSATVLLISSFGFHEEGILYGRLLGDGLLLLLLIPEFVRHRPRINLRPAIELARIGVPLVPATFASMWVAMSPRYMLEWFGTAADVGVFAMSAKIAGIVSLLFVQPFAMAWMVLLFKVSMRPDARQIYAKVITYYVFAGGLLALTVGLLAPELLAFLHSGTFPLSANVTTLMTLAFLAAGLTHAVTIGPYLRSRLNAVMPVYLGSVVASVAAGVPLTRFFGLTGEAFAMVMVYVLQALLLAWVSHRMYPISVERARIAKVAGALAPAYLVARWLTQQPAPLAPFAGLFAMYGLALLILWATGFTTNGERNLIRATFRKVGFPA